MRTTRIRATVLAATTAALALSLTACGGSGNGSKAAGSKSVATTVGAQSPEETTTETTETVETTETSGSSAGKAAPAHVATVQACKGDEISYSVLHRFPAEQGEHLLITATNADSKPCWVTSFPSVMLGSTSDVLPHSSKDAPGGTTRITVKPGGTIYSAVSLFAGDDRTHTSTDLSIALRDRTGDTGPGAGTGAFDAKGAPSEFTWSEAEVTNWNTTKPYDF
ncbi:DUF4232 domain-containing protein [Streptomyces sp. NPDC054866]